MKRLPNYSLLWVSFIVFLCTGCNPASQLSVGSPDGNLCLHVETENGKLYYELSRNGKPILDKSRLGFILKEDTLADHLEITEALHHSFSGTWEQIWGEDRIVENNYHEMTIHVQETSAHKRKFNVVFRLFNDGFGFRYEFPEQEALKDFVIMDELTEFALTGDHKAWFIPHEAHFYEALYEAAPVSKLGWVSTPLTMETNDGLFLSIHEANLTDYAAMNLIPKEGSTTLKANLTPWSTGEKVFMKAPGVIPWRTMIVAESAGDLLLSRLMLNLNEPCRIQDTSWIQPGRYIGIWWTYHMHKHTWHTGPRHGATTANALRHIDFAARHGFQGVLIEGWNKGWDTYHFNFTEPYPDFDLKQITDYAASKGVTLIGHHETDGWISDYENQIEAAFNLYKDHGVQIVKTGYVGKLLDGKERHSSQFGVRHYRKVIELAADKHIMIDNHEPVMPTGLQRTFPNLMTQEGVRGQEWDAWDKDGGNPPVHTTIIPFTRGLAGPMDFTPGTFRFENPVLPQTRVQTTLAKQLALSVVLYSPLQMASDEIENYERNPEPFSFITACPTTWEQTIVPEAKIGEYVTIVRKERGSSGRWFIGSITNEQPREMQLPLSFLDKGKRYKAVIYRDGDKADYRTNPYPVIIEEQEVTGESTLQIAQAPGGGTGIILTVLSSSGATSDIQK